MIKGILFSVSVSILFGGVYYLSVVLQPISGEGLFGWRTLFTFPFLIPAFFLLKQQKLFVEFIKRLKNEPHLIGVLLCTSINIEVQMYINCKIKSIYKRFYDKKRNNSWRKWN